MNTTRKIKLLAVALAAIFLLPGYFWLRASQPKVDLIIFSYDRPLQLYALLESTEKYVTGLGKTIVIYRSSNKDFHDAYDKVHVAFAWTEFWEQGLNPQADFKPLTMKSLNATSSSYVIFAVDDIVVKDYVDLAQCAQALDTYGAYGFYLRLGVYLTDCYACSAPQPLPRTLTPIGADMLTWTLGRAPYDWGYPNTVDMTVYRKADVIKDFSSFHFINPNTLEGTWADFGGRVAQRKGLCFVETKMVNLPLNRVQHTYRNRNMNSFTPQELLVSFNQDLKMDIQPLFKINNPGAHMEYAPTFVMR
jgi:hypothetical protein